MNFEKMLEGLLGTEHAEKYIKALNEDRLDNGAFEREIVEKIKAAVSDYFISHNSQRDHPQRSVGLRVKNYTESSVTILMLLPIDYFYELDIYQGDNVGMLEHDIINFIKRNTDIPVNNINFTFTKEDEDPRTVVIKMVAEERGRLAFLK
jgi:hypothetical protein